MKFQPGNNANPGGRPKLPEELRAIKRLTRDELQARISGLLRSDLSVLVEKLTDPKISALENTLIRNIIDPQKLAFILEHAGCKPREELDINIIKPTVIEKIMGGQVVLGTDQKQLPETVDGEIVAEKI